MKPRSGRCRHWRRRLQVSDVGTGIKCLLPRIYIGTHRPSARWTLLGRLRRRATVAPKNVGIVARGLVQRCPWLTMAADQTFRAPRLLVERRGRLRERNNLYVDFRHPLK